MSENDVCTGIYQAAGQNYGFFIPEGSRARSGDYFVPPRYSSNAWDGDQVEVLLVGEDPQRPGRPCARITQVLQRANKLVSGVVIREGRSFWLQPDNAQLPDIKLNGGKCRIIPGHKLAAAVLHYGEGELAPLASARRDFGPCGSRKSSVEAVLFQQGIERPFPSRVKAEADAIGLHVTSIARRRRQDFRNKLIITIDSASAKDLDDAVSLERDLQGHWVLGVHIADVSHYVRYGSPLDEEAFRRGTSVYFADQVIPMLPERLSNGICSLTPEEDRLTISCMMTLSHAGELLRYEITPSVICSAARMTYENCNILLEGGDPDLAEEYAEILPMLREMASLSKRLRARRFARGGLNLESRESAIVCDEEGEPVEVLPRQQGASEKLIEDFMLLANETVARHFQSVKKPAVYRVHEKPSQDKVETLRAMLSPLGYALKDGSEQSYQSALNAFRGRPEETMVNMMVLRNLMKARYSTENLGHFGLAAPFYCHFTSPIRRYPDLIVHRCLHALWDKQEQNPTRIRKLTAACERAAVQSSAREIAAQTAEREIQKFYFAEYMKNHVGETFEASVSGVTRFGIFATLFSGIEGLLPMNALPDDFYVYDEIHMNLTGERSHIVYTLGMPIQVVCVHADPATGRVDFRLPEEPDLPF